MIVRRVKQRVPMDEAFRRAQACGRGRKMVKANEFALAIWPGATWIRAQGAGAAASRILKAMEKQGLAQWESDGDNWGWTILNRPAVG